MKEKKEMGNFFFIVNPEAGAGGARDKWRKLIPRLEQLRNERKEFAFDYALTRCRGDGTQIAAAEASAGFEGTFVAVGGDGTVNELVNGLVTAEPEKVSKGAVSVGILPAGTGNDLAAHLKISTNPDRALDQLLTGRIRRLDLGRVDDHYFLNAAGAGFDGEVARAVRELQARWGPFAYLAAILKLLVTYRNPVFSFEPEGAPAWRQRGMLMAFGNGPRLGGGLNLFPAAAVDDGRLDFCLLGDFKPWSRPGLLVRVLLGRHRRLKDVRYESCRRMRVDADRPVKIQADGQVIGELPAEFFIIPGGISVVTPSGK